MMRKRIPRRFYFTQLSAFIPGVSAFVLPLILLRCFGFYSKCEDHENLTILFIYFGICFACIYLFFKGWAAFLVKIGLLESAEAKGYPYSAPWKDNEY
jgi:hypothetical protein